MRNKESMGLSGGDCPSLSNNTGGMSTTTATSGERIKKASYYVWFLGACECRGLRGSEVVAAVIGRLLGRERDQEPEKVTLQVSSKGIKLLQLQQDGASRAAKHLLPAAALTYVQQEAPPDDDLVTAVLLIYNPATRCPVHVHAYRCDSADTAALLKSHLSQLLNRPNQQAKLAALEARLAGRGLLHRSRSIEGGGTSSSGIGGAGGGNLAALYDSLAAELREKLGSSGGTGVSTLGASGTPLLLPPRDYHHAPRGTEDDSARSSGIGSDDVPQSPQLDVRAPLTRQHSSSDDEWPAYDNSADNNRDSGGGHLGASPWKSPSYGHLSSKINRNRSPRAVRPHKSDRDLYKTSLRESQRESFREIHHKESFRDKDIYKEVGRTNSRLAKRRGISPSRNLSPIRIGIQRRVPPAMKHISPQHNLHRDRSESPVSPRERFQDARDKFLSLEREWRSGGGGGGGVLREEPPVTRRFKSAHSNSRRDNREELNYWPKTDRDTGYGSRDALLRDKKPARDYDRGYGTCDTRDSELWKKEMERSPDIWDSRGSERSLSPNEESRKHFRSNRVRTPDRNDCGARNEYQRAKSMHDLSRHRSMHDEDVKMDFRRRSLYDTLESPQLQKSRSQQYQAHRYHSYGNLGRVRSSSPSSCSSADSVTGYELPESQRYPGLDRSTARPDPLVTHRYSGGFNKRTFDYPVNGGHAPIHISRAQHDDYRRFRYDHNPGGQFVRAIPAAQY